MPPLAKASVSKHNSPLASPSSSAGLQCSTPKPSLKGFIIHQSPRFLGWTSHSSSLAPAHSQRCLSQHWAWTPRETLFCHKHQSCGGMEYMKFLPFPSSCCISLLGVQGGHFLVFVQRNTSHQAEHVRAELNPVFSPTGSTPSSHCQDCALIMLHVLNTTRTEGLLVDRPVWIPLLSLWIQTYINKTKHNILVNWTGLTINRDFFPSPIEHRWTCPCNFNSVSVVRLLLLIKA